MSAFVLDASVAAAWIFDDEDEPRASAALAHLENDVALVPQLWHLEVRSALLGAERRGRISVAEGEKRLRFLQELSIRTDAEPDLGTALALARTRRLSFYDALYLELAQRNDVALATLDTALAGAAVAEGVALIEPIGRSR